MYRSSHIFECIKVIHGSLVAKKGVYFLDLEREKAGAREKSEVRRSVTDGGPGMASDGGPPTLNFYLEPFLDIPNSMET
ncbi:hypothetical protein Hdeb2414_s0096g00792161 [Helianthus debilis subsp. tardiflorus]